MISNKKRYKKKEKPSLHWSDQYYNSIDFPKTTLKIPLILCVKSSSLFITGNAMNKRSQ